VGVANLFSEHGKGREKGKKDRRQEGEGGSLLNSP